MPTKWKPPAASQLEAEEAVTGELPTRHGKGWLGDGPVTALETALRKAISVDRMATYRNAAAAGGCEDLMLYIWDRDLASAVLADIAIVEVALRNALHTALTTGVGRPDWYLEDLGLDDRSRRALTQVWQRLPKAKRTPGRVVARLMFGFWANLLDAGGYYGSEPQAFKADCAS